MMFLARARPRVLLLRMIHMQLLVALSLVPLLAAGTKSASFLASSSAGGDAGAGPATQEDGSRSPAPGRGTGVTVTWVTDDEHDAMPSARPMSRPVPGVEVVAEQQPQPLQQLPLQQILPHTHWSLQGDDMLMSGPPDPFQQLQPMTFLPMPWQEQQAPQGPQLQSGVQPPMTMPMNVAQQTQMFSGGPQIGGMQNASTSGGTMVVVPAGSVVDQGGGGGPQGFPSAPVPVGYVPMPQSLSDTSGIGYVPGHPVPMMQAPQQAGGDQQSQQLQMQLMQGFNLFQQTLMQQQMGGQYAPMVQPGGMMMAPIGSFVHPSQQPVQTPGPPSSNKDATSNKRERKTRAPGGDEKARRRGAGGNIGGGGRGDFPAEKFGSYTFPPNKKVGEVWHPNPTQGSRTLPSFCPQSESAGGTPAGSSEYSGAHSMFSFGSSSLQFAPDGAFGGGKGNGKNKRGGGRADASIPGPARGVTATLDLLPEHFEFLQEGRAKEEVVEDSSADKTSSASTTEVSGSGADSGMPGASSAPATATTLGTATVAPRAPAPAAKSYADALLKGVSKAAKEKASATTSSSSPATVVPFASSSATGGASSSPPPRPILVEDAARVVRKMEDTLAWKMVRLSAEDPAARKSFLNLAKSQEGSIVLQRKLTRIEVVGDDHVDAASAKDTCAQKEYDELLADLFDLRAVEISSTRLYLFPETAADSEEGLVTTAPLPTPDGDYIDIPVNTEIRRAVARQNARATSNYNRRGQPAGASTPLSDAVNAVSPTSTSSAAAAATTLISATRGPGPLVESAISSAGSDSACAFLRLLFAHVKRSFDSMLGDVHANRVLEVVLERFPAVWLVIVKSLVETRKQRIRELLMQHQQAAAGADEALPPGRCDDHASAPLSSEIGIRLIRSGDRFFTSDTGTTGYPVSEALTRQLIEDAGGSPGSSPGSRTLVLYNSPDNCILSKEMRKMSWSKVAVRAFQRFYWQYGKYVAERDREGGVFKRRGRATRSEDLDEYPSESDDTVVKKHRQGIEVLMQELTELYLPDLEFGLRKSGLPSGSDPSMVGRNRNTWTQKDLNRQLLGNKDQGITYLHIYRYLLQRGTEIGRSYAVGQQEDSQYQTEGAEEEVRKKIELRFGDDDSASDGGVARTPTSSAASPTMQRKAAKGAFPHSLFITVRAADRHVRRTLVPEPLITAKLVQRLNDARKYPSADKRFHVDYDRPSTRGWVLDSEESRCAVQQRDETGNMDQDVSLYLPQPRLEELIRIFKPLADVITRAQRKLVLEMTHGSPTSPVRVGGAMLTLSLAAGLQPGRGPSPFAPAGPPAIGAAPASSEGAEPSLSKSQKRRLKMRAAAAATAFDKNYTGEANPNTMSADVAVAQGQDEPQGAVQLPHTSTAAGNDEDEDYPAADRGPQDGAHEEDGDSEIVLFDAEVEKNKARTIASASTGSRAASPAGDAAQELHVEATVEVMKDRPNDHDDVDMHADATASIALENIESEGEVERSARDEVVRDVDEKITSSIGQLRLEDDEEVVDVDMLGGDAPQSCLHLQDGTLSGEVDVAEAGDDAAGGAGCGGDPDSLDDGFVTPCSALPPSDEDEEQTADEEIPDGMEAEVLRAAGVGRNSVTSRAASASCSSTSDTSFEISKTQSLLSRLPKAAAAKPKKKGSAPAEVVTTLETIGGRPVPPYTVKNTFVDVADSPGMRFPDAISPPALAERGNSAPTPTLASLVSSQDSLAAAGAPGGAGSAKPEEGEALGVLRQTSRFFGAGEAPSEEAEVHGEQ